jgi:hypothetical protein
VGALLAGQRRQLGQLFQGGVAPWGLLIDLHDRVALAPLTVTVTISSG